jgi:hypothetical protein
MIESLKIQAGQAVPPALEDDQRLAIVPAPELADLFTAGVDHAESVLLLGFGDTVEPDLNVQVLWRTLLGRSFLGAGPGVGQSIHIGHMPRIRIAGRSLHFIGQGVTRQGSRKASQQQHAFSHDPTPFMP